MKILITGACGLVGSETVRHFSAQAAQIVGIDNDMRKDFFGPAGSTTLVKKKLLQEFSHLRIAEIDIRDRAAIEKEIAKLKPDLIVHSAAQPSHDLAAKRPHDDFSVNALGTLNLLEAVREHSPLSVFCFMSTNKVYGDRPNQLELREQETRWEFASSEYSNGISEEMSIDRSLHSLFGVSKASADLLVQEYGRNFGMKTVSFRAGCITGGAHAGVELHGFLSYLAKCCLSGTPYTVYGYKGKQVRDQIHARDVAGAIEAFYQSPRPGAVYNLGGGKENSISMIEAIALLERKTQRKLKVRFEDTNRTGDHICYYSDLSSLRADYPEWQLKYGLNEIFEDILGAI